MTMVKKKENKSQVKVGKLKVNKETVKDLDDKEAKQIKGGGYTAGCYDGVQVNKPILTSGPDCR